jgi:hypothetical protein
MCEKLTYEGINENFGDSWGDWPCIGDVDCNVPISFAML